MSRLSIELSPDQHKHIKALALLQGKSIKDFILDKVFSGTNTEKDAWNELEEIISSRIENTELSSKSIDQISKEVIASKSKV